MGAEVYEHPAKCKGRNEMSMKKRGWMVVSLQFALVVGLMMAASITCFTQSDNSQLSGFVKDQAGAAISGAKVAVKNETREFQRTTTTNAEGYYVVPNLPPGFYTITVEASGFKLFQTTGKKLDPNIASNLDMTLVPGQLTETVNVTASTASVQTETATVGKLVEGKQIEALQLNGRNPLFLAQLKPGVAGNAMGGFNFGLTTASLNINGSRTQDNLITFDGAVGVRTRSNGTSIGVADLDSTQEVQILTANYNAEYGRAAGGQIRIVTKSGSRDFHGNFYEYLRNSAFNANEWQRNASAPLNQPCSDPQFEKASHCRPNPFRFNQFGYNLSGPVIIPGTSLNRGRDKLFWLWGQEWLRDRRGSNRTLVVPTLKMRQGDFSELAVANQFYTNPLFIPDPNKSGPCNAADQTGCFSDGGIINKIPASQLSANGLALLNAYPEPIPGFSGAGGANWFAERPLTTDQRKDTVSIDFYPNERHQLRWRMQLYHFLENNSFPFDNEPGLAPRIFDRPNQTTSINWVWTISPNWISETLVAGSRDQVFISVDTTGDLFRRSSYGINYPYIFPDNKEIPDKIPTVDGLLPFARLDGGPYPAQSTGPIYQVSNNLTNIRGSHTIKFGAYFERAGQNDFDQINVQGTPGGTNNQNGRFAFVDTGVPIDPNNPAAGTRIVTPSIVNAALGQFNTYAEIGQRSFTPYRGHMFEWFAQDGWKVTPKLRLEFGLRHTIIQPYYSLWGNMVVFDERYYDPNNVVTQNPANGFITGGDLRARHNGLVIPGDGWPSAASGRIDLVNNPDYAFLFRGDPKQYSEIHKNTFQPRVGIAYAFNDKTVIRAGAGRFLTRLGVSDSVFLGGNPPLQPTVSVTNGSVDNPGGVAGNAFPLAITTQDRVFKNPESWAWSATIQREITFNTTIEIGYVGRRGLHGQRERNINQLQPGTIQDNPGINADYLRPYKGLGIIRVTNNDANSSYHGFQVGVDRRFTNGLGFGAAYTLSKVLDDGSAQRFVIPNANDASALWGPADYDRRHVLVLNAIYEFPFFKDYSKLTGKILGGWSISAISQFQTGTPFSITSGNDFAGVGPGSGRQFWAITGEPQLDQNFSSNPSDDNYWFQATAVAPTAGTFTNQRFRNFIYGPGFQNHNIGIFKTFSITERHRLQFRAEAFNWLNHPNWGAPGGNGTGTYNPNNGAAEGIGLDPLSANFGKVSTKGSERQLQFALRYQF
jgi:Carboxypeptidase regulatory-like domain